MDFQNILQLGFGVFNTKNFARKIASIRLRRDCQNLIISESYCQGRKVNCLKYAKGCWKFFCDQIDVRRNLLKQSASVCDEINPEPLGKDDFLKATLTAFVLGIIDSYYGSRTRKPVKSKFIKKNKLTPALFGAVETLVRSKEVGM